MNYSPEIKSAAKSLFLKRYKVTEIEQQTGVNKRTLYNWITEGGWDDQINDESVESALARRITLLIEKEPKTDADLKELDRLFTHYERFKRFNERQAKAEKTGDSEKSRNAKKRERKKKKNVVSHLTADDFKQKLEPLLFAYQHELRAAKTNRIRNILKSRQIGATWYFAAEGFEDAVLTGDNQIFLSASRAQAEIFRGYIIQFAKEWFDIELSGNPIVLDNGATLYFLSNNSTTAQGYHGHVYIDEYFWIRDFDKLNKLASAMATHKKWRRTYFSTPSAVTHPAYPFWTGDKFNERNRKRKKADVVFPDFKAKQKGAVCPDGQWRKIITIEDALNGGCELFDIDQLRLEYSDDEFANLFMCQFVDDTQSVFKLKDLEKAFSDTALWEDYQAKAPRPYGNNPVWLGYDPSRTTDAATCAVLAPPLTPTGRFRVLEKHHWTGSSFEFQANRIKELTQKFNVEYIGIDTTGLGIGVFDLVQNFFRTATPIHYGLESKSRLVLKALDVVQSGRIEWDAEYTDIPHAFMTIKKTTTGGGQITYSASRTETTGHADVAWAIMHALVNEPLNRNQRKSTWAKAA